MAGIVSKTYGHALFSLGEEEGCLPELREEAETVSEVLRETPEIFGFYDNPQISSEEKAAFTETCFQGKVSDNMTGFLLSVVANGREKELPAILEEFRSEVLEYYKIGVCYVTTPNELSGELKQQVEKRLLETTTYKSFEMHYSIDAGLIGGMKIQIGDRVVDSSIRTQLNRMTKELLKTQIECNPALER